MDPEQAYKDMWQALAIGGFVEAAEHAAYLANWIDKKGFIPPIPCFVEAVNFVQSQLEEMGYDPADPLFDEEE